MKTLPACLLFLFLPRLPRLPLFIAHTSLIILVIVICIPTKQWCSLCSSNPNTHPKPTEPAKICFPTTQERLAGWQLSSTMRLAATAAAAAAAIAAMSMKEKKMGKVEGEERAGRVITFFPCACDLPSLTWTGERERERVVNWMDGKTGEQQQKQQRADYQNRN